jgi:hypothetical protein
VDAGPIALWNTTFAKPDDRSSGFVGEAVGVVKAEG